MHKIIIIGQAPSSKSNPNLPWSSGPSAERLYKWFGVENRKELLGIADLFHAVPYFPGRSEGKGDRVPRSREELEKIRKRIMRKLRRGKYNKVIVVGKFVENIIWRYLRKKGIMTLYIPHPSGVNISINGKDEPIKRMIKLFVEIGVEDEV